MEVLYNKSMEYFNITDPSDLYYPMFIYSWGVFSVGLPVSFLAVYGLYFQIKADHVTPVYVINLLISDVLQLCAKPTFLSIPPLGMVYELMVFIYALGLLSSTMFMVCIAAERYCMIAHPVWFRFRREIKNSIFVSFCVWLVAMATVTIVVLSGLAGIVDVRKLLLATMILSLLPYPFVLFFFMGTWRALSMSIALSRHERRRILGILAFVLCVYTVLFLPHMVVILILYIKPAFMKSVNMQLTTIVTDFILCLNPLVDPVLYVLMRKDKRNVLPSTFCCQASGHKQNQETSSAFMGETSF